MGEHFACPCASLMIIPGLISISSPTFRTPLKILPPATPPCKLSTSDPGLLTSKDLVLKFYYFLKYNFQTTKKMKNDILIIPDDN